jgi:hypothetical protein
MASTMSASPERTSACSRDREGGPGGTPKVGGRATGTPRGAGLPRPAILALGLLHLASLVLLAEPALTGNDSAVAIAAPASSGLPLGLVALLTGILLARIALAPLPVAARPAIAPPAGPPAERPERSARGPAATAALPVGQPSEREWAELIARVNHEIRTPLNAVLGFADVMSREMLGPLGNPRYREYARHIHDSGTRLLRAAEDTIAMTSLVTEADGRRLSPQALDRAFRDAWAASCLGRGGEPAHGLERLSGIEVRADHHGLRQALVNVLTAVAMRGADAAALVTETEVDGGSVRLTLRIEGQLAAGERSHPAAGGAWIAGPAPGGDLHLGLARRLLMLQDATLAEHHHPDGSWSVAIGLDHAAQPDFFALAPRLAATAA